MTLFHSSQLKLFNRQDTDTGWIMSTICRSVGGKPPAPPPAAAAPAAPAASAGNIPNRQAMVAAIAVAVAEEMGTDPAGIRILSIKQL